MSNTAAAESDPTMQVIPTEECHRLLASHEIGRIERKR